MYDAIAVAGFWLVSCLQGSPLSTEVIAIELHASVGPDVKPALAIYPPSQKEAQTRTILKAKVNQPVIMKWTLSNRDKNTTVKNVLVHFFLVKLEQPNQQEIPSLTKNVLAESALKMDFRPQDQSEGEITVRVDQPGCYLIRIEWREGTGKQAHVAFAALDLLVH